MKLLLFSDLHCDSEAAAQLVNRARSVDVVVGAGDFGTVRSGINICIEILQKITKPAILVAGNNESTEELLEACSSWPHAHVLHGSAITVGGVVFFGIGGGIPITPFGSWSYDFSEDEATKLLAGCPKGCVLVSHSPPLGAVDVSSSGRSLGSTAVREVILRQQPLLVVCGHIHGSGGQTANLGKSTVINAGPDGMEWLLAPPTSASPPEERNERRNLHG